MRLHSKIVVLLVPLVAAPLITLGGIAYTSQRDAGRDSSLHQMETLVDQVTRQVDARLAAARADTVLFSGSRVIHRYLLVEDEGQRYQLLQPSILKLFASYQAANPEYHEIRILLPDGYEDTRAVTRKLPNLTDDEAHSEFFAAMRDSPADQLVQILRSPDNGEPVALVSYRIALIDPAVDPVLAKPLLRGFLVVTMGLEFLAEQAAVPPGRGASLLFTDAAGAVLFDGDDTSALEPALFEKLVAGAEQDVIVQATYEQEPHLFRSRALHPQLYVHALVPEAELLAGTRRLAGFTLALTLAAVVITASLLYVLLRSLLLSPLARLGHAAREIGSGNLTAGTGISRADELGDLARSFEEMARNLRLSHEKIAHLAYHDSLTGLPNRRLFSELLEQAIERGRREGGCLGLLFLDLDDFKRVNDSLGHDRGDDLLREVARRLSKVVRPYDCVARACDPQVGNTVARLGGDEFIMLLPGLECAMDAATVARRVLSALALAVDLGADEVPVHTSIGITVFPQDGDTAEALIKSADIAMYHAKEQGKNRYQFYTESLNTTLIERMAMENALRRAIDQDEFVLHYQPQVHAVTGEIIGAEALLRWNSADRGMVPPGDFIPLAEETGLIIEIGDWVLREACRQNSEWQARRLPAIPLAVNVSSRQLRDTDLEESVKRALGESGLGPRYLDIELTETCLMDDPAAATLTLTALKSLGVRISMDDFGTGYSSLGSLKRLPIDSLKIDRSFVSDITRDKDDAAITTTIISMGRSLNLEVVAEGVETAEQMAFLSEHGCTRMQGFLLGRPMPACEMEALLEAHSAGACPRRAAAS